MPMHIRYLICFSFIIPDTDTRYIDATTINSPIKREGLVADVTDVVFKYLEEEIKRTYNHGKILAITPILVTSY